jgi:ribose 5-phosphate isomerase A
MKRAAALRATTFVEPGSVLGVGSGTTVNCFIDELGRSGARPSAAVAASRETRRRLQAIGLRVIGLDEAGELPVYVDGADEVDPDGRMLKGAGGAHTMEKAIGTAARLFVCIVDETKIVARLGERGPVALEVLGPSVEQVAAEVADMCGTPVVRSWQVSDSGNVLVDVKGLDLSDPEAMEVRLDAISGVVECGIFARRRADVVVVGEATGVRVLRLHSPVAEG